MTRSEKPKRLGYMLKRLLVAQTPATRKEEQVHTIKGVPAAGSWIGSQHRRKS